MRLVYLSPVPWSSFAQRPHKFVEWFHSRSASEVLWIDPYAGRLPVKGDLRRAFTGGEIKKKLSNHVDAPDWLTVLRPYSLPIEPLPGSGVVNRLFWKHIYRAIDEFIENDESVIAIGKPSQMAQDILVKHPSIFSIYDAMDDFPLFHKGISQVAMKKRDEDIASKASRILVSSTSLVAKYETYKTKTLFVLNGCTVSELPPVRIKSDSSDNPVLGYVGTISHWFDWPLVISLAEANSQMCVRLIGPLMAPPTQTLPDNVQLLPECNHSQAISFMQDFTVGLIPFKQSVLTESVDPIKYYEYRSLGLPVLTTPFGEMMQRDQAPGVFFITNETDLAQVASIAINFKDNEKSMQKFRDENSWNGRFDSSGLYHW